MMQKGEEIYVQDFIIGYLDCFTKGKILQNDLPWCDMGESVRTCVRKGGVYMSALHRMMLPYYEKYFFADPVICKHDLPNSRVFMENVAEVDPEFGIWASSQDIITATECWGDYMKRKRDGGVSYYFRLLRILFFGKFNQDWEMLVQELEEILFGTETNADYKTGELLCVLHATVRIIQNDWTQQKKVDMFELLYNHWDFMKHFYSVMIRRIVGSRLANFAAVTNNVVQTNDNHPHAHIFYCALTERMESFHLTDKQYKSLDKARERLRTEVLDKTKPSEILYELCDTLFPEEFQKMLSDHRPKSYDEVADENSQKDILLTQMAEQTRQLKEQIARITNLFREMVESSISIEEIEEELKNYPPGMAWDMLAHLNNDLSWNPVWREYYPALRDKFLTRLYKPIEQQNELTDALREIVKNPKNEYNVYPQAGSTTNVGCELRNPEFKVLQSANGQKPALVSNKKGNKG